MIDAVAVLLGLFSASIFLAHVLDVYQDQSGLQGSDLARSDRAKTGQRRLPRPIRRQMSPSV